MAVMTATEFAVRYAAGEREFCTLSGSWDMTNLSFPYGQLEGVCLQGVVLDGANLSCANLRRVKFNGASCKEVNFNDADLTDATFSGANCLGASFDGARLTNTKLDGVFRGATFFMTNLHEASLDLSSHDLIAAILLQAAGYDTEKRKIAGLVLASNDWCWRDFIWRLRHEAPELRKWISETLRKSPQLAEQLDAYGINAEGDVRA